MIGEFFGHQDNILQTFEKRREDHAAKVEERRLAELERQQAEQATRARLAEAQTVARAQRTADIAAMQAEKTHALELFPVLFERADRIVTKCDGEDRGRMSFYEHWRSVSGLVLAEVDGIQETLDVEVLRSREGQYRLHKKPTRVGVFLGYTDPTLPATERQVHEGSWSIDAGHMGRYGCYSNPMRPHIVNTMDQLLTRAEIVLELPPLGTMESH